MNSNATSPTIYRVVFNSNDDKPQKLILRPEGIEPDAENDKHIIEAETEATYEGVSVTPYGKIEPGSYDLYWKNQKISTLHLAQGELEFYLHNLFFLHLLFYLHFCFTYNFLFHLQFVFSVQFLFYLQFFV